MLQGINIISSDITENLAMLFDTNATDINVDYVILEVPHWYKWINSNNIYTKELWVYPEEISIKLKYNCTHI